jgi:hypothetical protein
VGLAANYTIPLIIAGILALGIILFLLLRKKGSRSLPKPAGETPFKDHSRDLSDYAAQSKQRTTPYQEKTLSKASSAHSRIDSSTPVLLNLFVEDQNTAIGKRNIHSLKSGYGLSVGGGNSDFLIFLVPLPPSIGEFRRDGSNIKFIPRKPKYFPDLGTNEVNDCLDKTIRIISDKNYELRMKLEQWEDPLEALNNMLNSLKIPR